MPKPAKENPRLKKLADAFADLTHRDMMDLSDTFVDLLEAQNGLKVKPLVIAEVLDGLQAYVAIETEER